MPFKILKPFSCFSKRLGGGAQLNGDVRVALKVIEHVSFWQIGQLEPMQNKSLLLVDKMLGKYERIPLSWIKRKLYTPLKACSPFSSVQSRLNGFK